MKIDVEVISREVIKPDSPTPDHLRHYQFSFLDQINPAFYMSYIYFYNTCTVDHNKLSNRKDISSKLKASLSKVLTYYYPLAGCVKDNSVDCNDEGALFLEAQVDSELAQIVHEPFTRESNKLLPYDGLKNSVLAIQINFFKCGTFAIGALLSHKIADAASMIMFIRNWAATALRGSPNFFPQFVSATLFPPKDFGGLNSSMKLAEQKNIVLKRFVFSGSAIAALKEKYTDTTSLDNEMLHPTRVEALSSFIWSRLSASTQKERGLERLCLLLHIVNLRTKLGQPLPDDQSFGNMTGSAATIFSEISGLEDQDRYGVVRKLRDAKSKVNNDYVKRVQQGVSPLDIALNDERVINQEKEIRRFQFSSFCRFPVYEADFGWGKPIWVALGFMPYGNVAFLLDTKCGDGIEAWIRLNEEDMAKFESDKELLCFLSCGQDIQG